MVKNNKIVYEQIIDRREQKKKLTVYDLEVDLTHNFVADNIIVHNSIYKFRGASLSNILQFKSCFDFFYIIKLLPGEEFNLNFHIFEIG